MEVSLLDLEALTNEERTIILNVIRRDDEVCRRLETRIKQLKAELHDIRMKSALRTGDDLSKMCARCHMIFGIFVNTGDICPGCHFRVCKNCRENLISHGWMCILCFRENQIRWLSGEWMGKDKTGKSKQIRATDLVRASLRIRHENRSLGGLEDRTGHGSSSSSDSSGRHTARVEYPQESDKRRLSTLLESLRSGFGAGTQDGVASATVGSTAGGEMVVQHVSCRRRRDSNSSSDSEPSCQTRETSGARKSRSSGSETLAVGKKASARHGQGDLESALTTRVSSASRLAPESPDCEVMSSRREGQARRSADPVLDGGRRHAQSETWAGVEDGRDKREVRRRILPQPHLAAAAAVAAAAAADTRPKSGDARSPSHLHDRPEERLLLPAPVTPSADDDHSSGCSFTSSEWGEVTPTSPSADTPSRRPGHSVPEGLVERRDQSSVDHSSGYLSFPKRSGENSHFANEHFTKASHNPPRSSSSEITLSEARPQAGEGRLEVPVMQVHVQAAQEDPPGAKLNRSPAKQHVRRHSSGRSDASLASARTASPATKLRLLDLASQRALDRDGDSLVSWSGGSEDTLSLGMSCTGLRASPEAAQSLAAPTGRRPPPKPPGPSQGSAAGDEKSSSEEHSLPAEGDSSNGSNGDSENGHRKEISPVTKFVPSGAANAVPADSVHIAGVVLCPSDVHAHSFSLPQSNQDGAVTIPFDQESMQAKGDLKQKNDDGSRCGKEKDMITMNTTSQTLLSGLERKSLKELDTKSQDKNDNTCHENTSPVLHNGGKDEKSCIIDMCSQAGNTREVNKESEGLVEDHVEHISHHHCAGEEQFEGRVISLVPEAGECEEIPLAALRTPKNELPYTLQLFLRCNSSTSDTLSIISELSEPSESCHEDYLGDERARDLLDDDEGSDDTVCNEPHVSWSDKHATHASFNVEKSEDKEALLLDEENEHDLGKGLVVLSESASGNRSRVEVASEVEHSSAMCHVCPPLEAFSQKVYFAGKGVRDVAEGTRAEDIEAKVEETSSSSSQTKPIYGDGHKSEVKRHSLSSEKEDEKYLSQVGGDALGINVDEAEEENQDLRKDYKGSVCAVAAIVDKENAFDDEENLGSTSSSGNVQENTFQQEIKRNVTINTAYERNVIIDTTYEKKVSDEVDKQPIESELVLDSGLGQEANLIVEFIEEKSNADEGTEVPCTVTQIFSNTQREIKPLVTGTDGTPSIPEQSGAGYCGQNVTAAAGRVTDTTVPPKPVDLGQKVIPAAGRLPVIITPTAASDSDKDITTDVPDGAESQQKLPPDISISRPADADSAGSEQSGSPEKRSSPHRNSHLSIPSAATGSQSGSHDERSFDDDDDNIDELFANHRSGSRLSAMRNNIGDSRESLASVYSNAGEINYGRIPVTGDIVFGLDYDHRHSVLKIDVRNCQNIAPVDTKHNRSDPYVKVYLLPDKTRSGKRKTKIKKHTLNPVFNEVLTYNISRGELENRTLWVTVWHSDRFGRNDFLGEVLIAMDTYRFDDPSPCAYSLQSREQESVGEAMQYKGELSLSLMYVTPEKVAAASQKSKSKQKKSKSAVESMGEIHVMIKSASNLTAVRSNGTSDPFVKGYLLPDRARNGKQKTPVVKNTVNPTWSHILVFDGITPEEISERSLELTVWDHEKLGTNEFLGGARLNTGVGVAKGLQVDWMDARGEEAMVWQAIMEHHNVWIDARLPLRASMGKPSKK